MKLNAKHQLIYESCVKSKGCPEMGKGSPVAGETREKRGMFTVFESIPLLVYDVRSEIPSPN